jgi:Tol biopolymer transport system component
MVSDDPTTPEAGGDGPAPPAPERFERVRRALRTPLRKAVAVVGAVAVALVATVVVTVVVKAFNIDGSQDTPRPVRLQQDTDIFYTATRGAIEEVIVTNQDGTEQNPLAPPDGSETDPAWAGPTGELAVAARNGNQSGISIVDTDTASRRPVLLETDALASSPTWSPLADQIAFTRTANGHSDIYVVGADGSNAHALTTLGGSQPSWGPTGQIAFVRATGNHFHIWLFDVVSHTETQLTQGDFDDSSPSWAPDGTQLVYSSTRAGGSSQIVVIRPDGKGERAITFSSLNEQTPEWSPKGDRIAFVEVAGDSGTSVWTVGVDGNSRAKVLDRATISRVSWLPDGNRLSFSVGLNGQTSIFRISPNGGLESAVFPPGTYNVTPAVSPKRDVLAFMSSRAGGHQELWVSNLDGGDPRRITTQATSGLFDSFPSWSPDAKRLVFDRGSGNDYDLYIVDVKTHGLRRLTYSGAIAPAWSPKGDWIAFASDRDGTSRLYEIRPDGSDEHAISPPSVFAGDVTFSPDGTMIAYVSVASGSQEIFTADADGTNPVQVTRDGRGKGVAAFSPTGDRLAFTEYVNGRYTLSVSTLSGSGLTQLTTSAGNDQSPTW